MQRSRVQSDQPPPERAEKTEKTRAAPPIREICEYGEACFWGAAGAGARNECGNRGMCAPRAGVRWRAAVRARAGVRGGAAARERGGGVPGKGRGRGGAGEGVSEGNGGCGRVRGWPGAVRERPRRRGVRRATHARDGGVCVEGFGWACTPLAAAMAAATLDAARLCSGRAVARAPRRAAALRSAGGRAAAPSRAVTCMAKKVTGVIKLAIDAGKASPAPPIGPALGSKGVNIMGFCKEYNAATQQQAGMIIPVEITVYEVRAGARACAT